MLKYSICLYCAYVYISGYWKIKYDIFKNEWLVTELKAIKWQGSNQARPFIVVIYLKPLELHDELPLSISYNSQSNTRLLEA